MPYEMQFVNVPENPYDKVVREVQEKFEKDIAELMEVPKQKR